MPGLGRWSVGPCCGCTSPSCNVTMSVVGCASKLLPGATFDVYADSTLATLIGSAATNSSGNATVNVGATGTYWRRVAASKFATSAASLVVSTCGTIVPLMLAVASGSHCNSYCPYPVPDTLYYTDTTGKAITLTYQAGGPDNGKRTGSGGGVTIKLSFPFGNPNPTILVEDSRLLVAASKIFTCVDPFAYTGTNGSASLGDWTYTITE